MNLYQLLRAQSEIEARSLVLYAVLAGLFQGLVIAIIYFAAGEAFFGALSTRSLLLYLICIAIFLLAQYRAHLASSELTEGLVEWIRVNLGEKIQKAKLATIERLGPARIHGVLTKETTALSEAAPCISYAISAAALILSAFLYIGFLLPSAFRITVFFFGLGAAFYVYFQGKIQKELIETTRKEEEFQKALADLSDGIKELKLDDRRSEDFFENHYKRVVLDAEQLQIKICRKFNRNSIMSYICYFLAVGGVLFGLPIAGVDEPIEIFQITAVLLFVFGPLEAIVYAYPFIEKASAAIKSVHLLQRELSRSDSDEAAPLTTFHEVRPFETIRLKRLKFQYKVTAEARPFTVGPIDLSIESGETIFLVGGNGSGKTTLVKMLTGLYEPDQGEILLDGEIVNADVLQRYRELFTPVFTDFHLFDRLYGALPEKEAALENLLDKMQLSGKTALENGEFTQLDLSTGQKKRLAMATALLEDRQIFIFDEPAADQDPEFRRYFYEVIFKRLKENGKTVIVVSHDENFFSVADRILTMEYGRIVNKKKGLFW